VIASNAAKYPCVAPATIQEALEQKRDLAGLTPIAGGTEIMVLFNEGFIAPAPVQSLHRLAGELRYVRETVDGQLAIGALATYTDVRHHPIVRERYPLLVESARVTGSLQIQNRGTLAGNIVNGSPAADSVPVLMVYEAMLRLQSAAGGERLVPINGFYTGYRQTVLRPDELLVEILLPARGAAAGDLHYYRKVGTRTAQAISKVVVAGVWEQGGAPRLAWGSVGPVTLRTPKTEQAVLSGAAGSELSNVLLSEISPMDDIRSTAVYRQRVACNLLQEFARRKLG